ncbi:MAG TPA: hypothetical protein VFO84_09530 [Dehalococcoidia bacterium]|nr:hypothetical protein [Dehalococcoidia bacterium]
MVATIRANPNPVVFPWPRLLGAAMNTDTVPIIWDADGVLGRVYQFINGQEVLFDGDPQTGNLRGRKATSIELGQALEFRLRQVNAANTLLASVVVTTAESPILPLAVDQSLSLQAIRGQAIFGLTVRPGVDSVAISFRTRQPTGPFVEIINNDTGEIAGLFGSGWGRPEKQQIHTITIDGWKTPFAQDTEHRYRIVARPMPGSWDLSNAEATGTFRTGSRTATVFFDKIHVRNDGDPAAAGEFSFTFGTGDADNGSPLGSVETYGETSITDGHTEDVNRSITITQAPRMIWAQVVAKEDDSYYNPFDPSVSVRHPGMKPEFKQPGAWIKESEYWVLADLTDHFDISELLNGTSETPFEMSTPDWAIAFSVSGRIKVEAKSGEWLSTSGLAGLYRPFVISREGTARNAAGPSGLVAGQEEGEDESASHRFLLDPDGALYHAAPARGRDGRSREGRWTNLGGKIQEPLTVLAIGEGTLALVGLSEEGAVLYRKVGADGRFEDWQALGGSFVRLAAVATAQSSVELFAVDPDGSMFRRAVGGRSAEADWQPFAEGVVGSPAVVSSPSTGISVFALSRGALIHNRRSPEDSWSEAPDWERLAEQSGSELSAEWVAERNLLLAVVDEDETVRILSWPGYPDADQRKEWQVIGTVNSLLAGHVPDRQRE